MADQGTHRVIDTPSRHLASGSTLSVQPHVSRDWGAHRYITCGGDEGEEQYLLIVSINHVHTVSSVAPSIVVEYAVDVLHEHSIEVFDIRWGASGDPPPQGPAPVGVALLGETELPRKAFHDVGLEAVQLRRFPHLELLERSLRPRNVKKRDIFQALEAWIRVGRAEGDNVPLELTDNNWPVFNATELAMDLEQEYDRDTARKLATAITRWSEQQGIDEAENLRTIYVWTKTVAESLDLENILA